MFLYFNSMLDVFVRCGDHAPFYNLSNVTLKNLSMFNVNSFCLLHFFFAHCFYLIVEFFVLRKRKRNKLPTTICCNFLTRETVAVPDYSKVAATRN